MSFIFRIHQNNVITNPELIEIIISVINDVMHENLISEAKNEYKEYKNKVIGIQFNMNVFFN